MNPFLEFIEKYTVISDQEWAANTVMLTDLVKIKPGHLIVD